MWSTDEGFLSQAAHGGQFGTNIVPISLVHVNTYDNHTSQPENVSKHPLYLHNGK